MNKFKMKVKKRLTDELARIKSFSSDFYKGEREGINFALYAIDSINEPEKPVVSQFVADWYEENKGDIENSIFDYSYNWNSKDTSSFGKWFSENDNKPIQTLVNMHQFGYEVKKEKLYTVSLKKSGIGIGVQQQDGSFKERFAKEELKEYGFDNLDEYEVKEVDE